MPVCQTRHQTHSRHGGTHEDYSLTGAQKSNSPGPWGIPPALAMILARLPVIPA